MKRLLALAAAACMAASALAQALAFPAAFQGNWKATWSYKNREYAAELKIDDKGGSWQTANSAMAAFVSTDPSAMCKGRAVPMAIDAQDGDSLKITLKYSDVIHGCADVKVTLKAGADGSLSGTRSGLPLTLQKQ